MTNIEKIEDKTNNNLFNLILKKISVGKKVLVLLNTKKKCENHAKKFFEFFEFMNTNEENIQDLIYKISNTKNFPTEKCVELSKLIKRRIAYYHSEILQKQKDLIINNFMKNEIRVLFTTNSFGSSFTFDNCCLIIENYKKFTLKKESCMSFFEYYQIYSSIKGNENNEVVILENEDIEKVNELYFKKTKEEIFSKLSVDPILKKYALYLISFGFVNLKDELIDFFQNTFYSFQYGDLKEIEYKISDIVNILKKNNFVIQEGKYLISTPLGKFISQSYLEIKTGILLCDNIHNINKLITNKYLDENKKIKTLLIFLIGLDEFKPLFKTLEDEFSQIEEKIGMNEENLDRFFNMEITNKRDFPKIIKTTEVLESWINEKEENEIRKRFTINLTRLKKKIKTMNHILYSLEKLSKIKHYYYLKNYIIKLRHRFIYGIKSDLIPISNFKMLDRKDLRNLYNFGYKTIYDLKNCDKKDLKYLINGIKYNNLKEILSIKSNNLENYELQIPEDISMKKVEIEHEEIDSLVEHYTKTKQKEAERKRGLFEYF